MTPCTARTRAESPFGAVGVCSAIGGLGIQIRSLCVLDPDRICRIAGVGLAHTHASLGVFDRSSIGRDDRRHPRPLRVQPLLAVSH